MRLAADEYGLVAGGWPGVDATVARAFGETISEQGLAPEDRLIQVIVKHDEPAFAAAQLFFFRRGEEDWSEPIRRANAILLLGGLGGIWTTGEMALEMPKPVLPLADTGGDAKKLYIQMLMDWERFAWIRLNREQFQRVARPRQTGIDAALEAPAILFPHADTA